MLKRLLAALLITALLLPASHISAADQLDVKFELTRSSPVSVEFRVTIFNQGQNVTNIPVEVLFERLPVSSLKGVSITEVTLATLIREEPVIESIEERYKPTGIIVLSDIEGQKYFVESPVGKKGEVTKEGYYEYYDAKTNEFVWHEDVVIGYNQVPYQVEQAEPFKEWYTQGKTSKLTAAFNQPSKDDNEFGWGKGVRVFDVKIETGLMLTGSGWGSKGLMVWDVAGKLWWDDTNSSWWDTDWLYRRTITIDNADIAENLIDFPVGIFLTNANFDFSQAQPDGDDIRFVDDDEATDLDHEVVSWNYTDDGIDNDSAEIWVEVPQIDASSDTDFIIMYWGNSTCANGENVAGTWNAGYVAVYHMNDNPADSTQILDSTSNGLFMTRYGAITEVAGGVGRAQSYNGTDAYTAKSSLNIALNAITIEAMAFFNEIDDTYNSDTVSFLHSNVGFIRARNYDEFNTGFYIEGVWRELVTNTSPIANDTWVHIAGSYDSNTHVINGLVNGSLLKTATLSGLNSYAMNPILQIGTSNATYRLDGLVDELRISSVARSAGWIAATNKSLRDTLVTYGAVSGKPLAPTSLTATTSGNNIILDWTKGYLALDTILVKGLLDYPASMTDGEVIYNGALDTLTLSGEASEAGVMYISAWSSSDWGDSDDYTTTIWGGDMLDTINQLLTLGLQICFMALIVALAYWKKETLLYVLASLTCFMFAFMWLQDMDIRYMLIMGLVSLALGVLNLYIPLMHIMQKRG